MGKKYYAVRRGRQPGIYTTWAECKKQVNGFAQAEYRSFTLKLEAHKYLSQSPSENAEQKLSNEPVYLLQYDGASKGNPGKAGAGALLRHPDGSVLQELAMGLGTATNNFAEYKGLILGLQAALDRDITRICVQGDSNLVCKQVAGQWNVNCESLKPLHAEALSLSKQFREFSISHIDRELNSAADALANKGIEQPLKQIVRKLSPESNGNQIRNVKTTKRGMEPVYILQYDGASKGNPGQAGAGALLRTAKGSVVEKLYIGLGITTNNVAEYEGLILGLKAALKRNITHIEVRGDSNLVSKQVVGEWAVKHERLRLFHGQVQRLKQQFTEFSIHHIDRELNADADALANKGISLPCGTIVVKPSKRGIKEIEKSIEHKTEPALTDESTRKSTIKKTNTKVKINEEVKVDDVEGAARELPVKSRKRRSKKDTESSTVEVTKETKTEMDITLTKEPETYSQESSIITTNMDRSLLNTRECALSTASLTQRMEVYKSSIGPMRSLRRFNVINVPGDRTMPTFLQSSCRLYHQIYSPRFKPPAAILRSSARHVTRFPSTRRISTIAAAIMSFL